MLSISIPLALMAITYLAEPGVADLNADYERASAMLGDTEGTPLQKELKSKVEERVVEKKKSANKKKMKERENKLAKELEVMKTRHKELIERGGEKMNLVEVSSWVSEEERTNPPPLSPPLMRAQEHRKLNPSSRILSGEEGDLTPEGDEAPLVAIKDDFLSAEDAEALIELARPYMLPASVLMSSHNVKSRITLKRRTNPSPSPSPNHQKRLSA